MSDREDAAAFVAALDEADPALESAREPRWVAWRHALTARRWLAEDDPDAAPAGVAARARGVGERPPRPADPPPPLAPPPRGESPPDPVEAGRDPPLGASLLAEGPAA